MNELDLKKVMVEAIKEVQTPPPKGKQPRKMEFSKKLMLVSTLMMAGTWAATIVSWFMFREIPWEFTQYATWLYGASFVSYCAKTAYENKPKIEKGGGGL